MATRVLILDDNAAFLRTLQRSLGNFHWIEIVGAFQSGYSIGKHIKTLRPDAVITDLEMPEISGLEIITQIREQYPHIAVVALTLHRHHHYQEKALEAGAHGFVVKQELSETLIPVLEKSLRAVHKISGH